MPRVTFSTPTVTAIKIRGEGGSGPRLPDDGGLVGSFLHWMVEAQVFPLGGLGGFSGGGGYLGFFDEGDAAATVRAWLEEHGAVEDDEKTWEKR